MSDHIGHRCPKCGRARADGAASCARCGLVYALWSKNQTAQDTSLDPEGTAMFAALAESWDAQAGHDAFLKHCAKVGRLAAAGRAYREFLDGRPGDPTALKMQNRIVGMATAVLLPLKSSVPQRSRGNWFLWILAVGAVMGVLAGLFFQALSD